MHSIGKYSVYFTGSRKTLKRAIYEDAGRFFCKWYGQLIEVKKGLSGYYTVEQY